MRESKNRNAAESAKDAYKLAAEREKSIEIAKNLIGLASKNDFIVKATGLTLEQIQELRAETNK